MQIYSVGGYVRDTLLSKRGTPVTPGDRDWVVVGETPEAMLARGYQPVGGDFPVFLHPRTHEEYALARTERKTAPGYHGFVFHAAPDVTLEEDLRRRDLTINAIAMDREGNLTDPWGGVRDLERGILRHVSEAFAEDPVRILRTARFAARFPGFSVAPETMALMRSMVEAGEADALVAERVLAEFVKGLATPVPCRMLDVLEACGLWERLFHDVRLSAPVRARIHRACRAGCSTSMRLALLACALPDGAAAKGFLARMRASADAQGLASILGGAVDAIASVGTPEEVSLLFRRADALRRTDRMREILFAREHAILPAPGAAPTVKLERALEAWISVDAGAIAKATANPREIPARVLAAREAAVASVWTD
ncbi:CCA-adding protein [Sutterella sp.]|uniref:CCA-adding protein n=1 Tax=Sutterella sp. TaxID=1981025 RepID=UPI0026E07907|nr:CCA-adding protein [Sutterella sp.]MDO5532134.1 CCA-adding protein [Sutterella sp.]